MKKISVILPFYNVEKYVDRVMTSLKDQTLGFDNMEVICVDDCSTDSTVNKLHNWEAEYPDNIMLIKLPSNSRQGAARNIGLTYASCDYIVFIDSDDWVEKNYLEKLYDIATTGSYDLVQCDYIRDFSSELVYNDRTAENSKANTPSEEFIISNDDIRKKTLKDKQINNLPHCKLLKKSLLLDNNIVFTEGLAYEDSYFGVLLNMYFDKAYYLHEKLYHYFVNQSSTSLTTNDIYHVDLLTNQITLWNELIRRGFMENFKDEIELEFMYSCGIVFWKMIILRYDTPSYPLYRLLCSVIQDKIPNILSNKYILAKEVSETHALLAKSCINPLSKADFLKFAEDVKKIGL